MTLTITQKLPDCPKCGLDEMYFWPSGEGYLLRCYCCTFDSGYRTVPEGMTVDEHVVKIVGVVNAMYDKIAGATFRDSHSEEDSHDGAE